VPRWIGKVEGSGRDRGIVEIGNRGLLGSARQLCGSRARGTIHTVDGPPMFIMTTPVGLLGQLVSYITLALEIDSRLGRGRSDAASHCSHRSA
jgi:hypothetical protein